MFEKLSWNSLKIITYATFMYKWYQVTIGTLFQRNSSRLEIVPRMSRNILFIFQSTLFYSAFENRSLASVTWNFS